MKSHAWRLGENADFNTHTVLNACPQKQRMNNGGWRGLEEKTGDWADKYGAVWIMCGPILYGKTTTEWIGDEGEVKAAVPDAFFKIVVKDALATDEIDVLAFIFPMHGGANYGRQTLNLTPYLTSVDVIEALTGLDFFKNLSFASQTAIERIVHTPLWE